MSIHFNGHTYWLQVQPGVEGLQQFKTDVCKLLGLTDDQPFDITFECRVPGQGEAWVDTPSQGSGCWVLPC